MTTASSNNNLGKSFQLFTADYERDIIFGSVGGPLLQQEPLNVAECTCESCQLFLRIGFGSLTVLDLYAALSALLLSSPSFSPGELE